MRLMADFGVTLALGMLTYIEYAALPSTAQA